MIFVGVYHRFVLFEVFQRYQANNFLVVSDDGDLFYLIFDQQLFTVVDERVEVTVVGIKMIVNLVVNESFHWSHPGLHLLIARLETLNVPIGEDSCYDLLVGPTEPRGIFRLFLSDD